MDNPQIVAPRQEAHQPISPVRLWYSMLIGPIGWTLMLLINYSLVPTACGLNSNLILYLVVAVAALAQIAGIYLAWQDVQTALSLQRSGRTVVVHRALFMARVGLAASGYFLLITLLTLIPIIGLNPCNNHTINGMPTIFVQR